MEALQNLDLLSVGIAIAAIGILGFVVFFNNRKSITNITFLFFSLATIFWGVVNYIFYQVSDAGLGLLLLRFVMFFAIFQAFGLFQLFYVFPKEKIQFPKFFKFGLFPLVVITAIFTLTSFVLAEVEVVSETGRILQVKNGPGIAIFGLVAVGLVVSAIFQLIQKLRDSSGIERKRIDYIFFGAAVMFALIITFNFVFPAFLENSRFVPLGAVFVFPFVTFTAYSVIRYKLLDTKVITTEIIAFILSIVTLIEVILSDELVTTIFRAGVFLVVLGFSILLIQSVRREVEQRERLEELTKSLEDANQKLKALDKLRSEFLSFAAHQVRSPMSVVKGYATLIYDGTYGNVSDEVKDKARKIKLSANRLIALVNNLLDMRKIEEGKMEFDFAEADIVKFVAEIAEEYKFLAEEKKLEFSFESTLSEYKMQIDEQKLRQVIQNLLDNSVKYTDKGFVKLYLTEKEEFITLAVSDSGRGMSQDLQKKLFQQFVRDEKTKLEIQGTGLGLFIAKQIVEAHHGTVTATSEGEGKGSTFTVKLRKK